MDDAWPLRLVQPDRDAGEGSGAALRDSDLHLLVDRPQTERRRAARASACGRRRGR
ncbi:protein of unassigned function [Methylobacterium oryzae CBMB20]|uniref:Protein of unassigned function n=1 Tax=Methylobacterium oryzae CBMB20 TaxID=693986 RepID=A0A089Q3T3_9HYPH|nr:protein of unassigned function [Methylobacterium oryzae CBMB20]